MTSDEGPSTADDVEHDRLSALSTRSAGPAPLARSVRPLPASRRRPWWQWLLIGMLLAFSLATTGLYAASLVADLSQHHWGAALDASRGGVPAAVGWAALLLLFYPRRTAAAQRLLAADDQVLAESVRQAARDQTCVIDAEHKVRRLSAKLDGLMSAREHASSGSGPAAEVADRPADAGVTYLDPGAVYLDPDGADLDRDIVATTARLDHAKQQFASARTAVSVSQRAVAAAEERLLSDFPELARRPDPATSKPA